MSSNTFLTAEWKKLAIANYEVDKSLLLDFLPHGTEFDLWNDRCYVSLVGFKFVNTCLKGFKIPFHSDFEEVNLRFYVKYKDGDVWKRGVTFIKELVPKPALTLVANIVYGENYETLPMSHSWRTENNDLRIEYHWKKKAWHSIQILAHSDQFELTEGSEEEFITEHYWGYTKINPTKTSEYGVDHPKWKMYKVEDYSINVDFGEVFGEAFTFLSHQKPVSVMLAEGSEISVKVGRTI